MLTDTKLRNLKPVDKGRSVYERELKPKFGNQKLVELTHEDLRH